MAYKMKSTNRSERNVDNARNFVADIRYGKSYSKLKPSQKGAVNRQLLREFI